MTWLGNGNTGPRERVIYVSGWTHPDHVHFVGESLIEHRDGKRDVVSNLSIHCKRNGS